MSCEAVLNYLKESNSYVESSLVDGFINPLIVKYLPLYVIEYLFEPKHELSFSDKIYILDKIKDVFMHTKSDETMYDFDFSGGNIVLKNIADDYSLECKIPFVTLYKFNRYVMEDFDKSSPSIMWAVNFLNRNMVNNAPKIVNYRNVPGRKQIFRAGWDKIVIKGENDDLSFYQQNAFLKLGNSPRRMSREGVEAYHTPSYVASIVSSFTSVSMIVSTSVSFL